MTTTQKKSGDRPAGLSAEPSSPAAFLAPSGGGGGGGPGLTAAHEPRPRRHSLNPAASLSSSSSSSSLDSPPSPFRRASFGGAGGGGVSPTHSLSSDGLGMAGDDFVEQTNEDATLCKKSAVRFGYWRDPYVDQLAPRATERKAPEIHLGYYTRVAGMRALLDKAMEYMAEKTSKGVQVINLGAGFDTLYWRLKDDLEEQGRQSRLRTFVEVDFPGVTARKCFAVKRSKALLEKVAGEEGEVRLSKTDMHGCDYHVVAADLASTARLEEKLEECGVDFGAPTVFVAECVLVYLPPRTTDELLGWLAKRFAAAPLAFLDHEQVNLRDRFGQVMLENLSARGCGLAGAESCRDKEAQASRFTRAGWGGARCWTMSEAYALLPADEVERVERLELFDERELMQQLFDHYCLTVSWRDGGGLCWEDLGDAWLWASDGRGGASV